MNITVMDVASVGQTEQHTWRLFPIVTGNKTLKLFFKNKQTKLSKVNLNAGWNKKDILLKGQYTQKKNTTVILNDFLCRHHSLSLYGGKDSDALIFEVLMQKEVTHSFNSDRILIFRQTIPLIQLKINTQASF